MNEHDIRVQIHAILDSHAEALAALRASNTAMHQAFAGHDAAMVSAIEANRAALRLLNRLIDEGITE
jgi:hypothetical protein